MDQIDGAEAKDTVKTGQAENGPNGSATASINQIPQRPESGVKKAENYFIYDGWVLLLVVALIVVIIFIVPGFTASQITNATTSVTTAITTVPISTIKYTESGDLGNSLSRPLSLMGGYSLYICSSASAYSSNQFSSASWIPDAQIVTSPYYVSVGHQSSEVCSVTPQNMSGYSISGIGLLNPPLGYSVINYPTTFNNASGGFISNYSVTQNDSFVVIALACGGKASCNSIKIGPGNGCSTLTSQGGGGATGSSYIAVCQSQDVGNYNVEGRGTNLVAIGVYDFGAPQ